MIKETRVAMPMKQGKPKRMDYEYSRCGVCNIFMANEPLAGKRMVETTQKKKKSDWAAFIKAISQAYPKAKRITLVMDNFKTHTPGALYETYPPNEAKALWDRFEFIYTPKHGSWLNMAEIELSVLNKQCLNRRIDCIDEVRKEVKAWVKRRNNSKAVIDWQFTTEDARIKLKRLYPSIYD